MLCTVNCTVLYSVCGEYHEFFSTQYVRYQVEYVRTCMRTYTNVHLWHLYFSYSSRSSTCDETAVTTFTYVPSIICSWKPPKIILVLWSSSEMLGVFVMWKADPFDL